MWIDQLEVKCFSRSKFLVVAAKKDMFWAKVPQNRTFCLVCPVCCRHTCWFVQRCFAMCRHTLVAQHFCPFSVFDIFWPFVAKPNVFFFNGIFPIFPYPSHLPCCGPKPQTTAKLAPHNVVAQRFDCFCHLCAWARCAGDARWGMRGETACICCGMCKATVELHRGTPQGLTN